MTAVQQAHRAALLINRRFWRVLAAREVTFHSVAAAFEVMHKARHKAGLLYRSLLERYPKEPKVLRCYGRYLEDVVNDVLKARSQEFGVK